MTGAQCCAAAAAALVFLCGPVAAQERTIRHALDNVSGLKPVDVRIDTVSYRGRRAVHVINPPHTAEGTIVLVAGTEMFNGTIDLDVAGRPADGAPADVRGFIGLAFRAITDSAYESFYIRATNGRADDQIRRNHATQYISAPAFLFDRLRKEEPERYESYVDLETGVWTHLHVEVRDSTAMLYVNRAPQPVLIVDHLKGTYAAGRVALWIGDDTDGYFSNLEVTISDTARRKAP